MPTASESQAIALLAKEWDMTGPPGIMDINEMVGRADPTRLTGIANVFPIKPFYYIRPVFYGAS